MMAAPLYILGDEKLMMPNAVKLTSAEDVRQAYAKKTPSVWLAPDDINLSMVTKAVTIGKPRHALLNVKQLPKDRRTFLNTLFTVVVEPTVMKMLPLDELREVLTADNRQDLVVAAHAFPQDDVLVLYRGDLQSLIVPLSVFKPKEGGPRPTPEKLSVTDYGQTVCLGDYEIATDALLYEFDPAARRRAKRRELKSDQSLGASIRRLRLQKGRSRSDFSPITAKTIGRVERGENNPHPSTLAIIAKTLGVETSELETF